MDVQDARLAAPGCRGRGRTRNYIVELASTRSGDEMGIG